jgi:hypothetical protein
MKIDVEIDIDDIRDQMLEKGNYYENLIFAKDIVKDLNEDDFYNFVDEEIDLYWFLQQLFNKNRHMFNEYSEYIKELEDANNEGNKD